MGLDMFLERNGKEVGYWRKANAIHGFFNRELGGESGLENCQKVAVSCCLLQDLLAKCERVLAILAMGEENEKFSRLVGFEVVEKEPKPLYEEFFKFDQNTANEVCAILPPMGGFFFGSTEIDESYKTDIAHTVEICKSVLEETDWTKDEVEYHAWW